MKQSQKKSRRENKPTNTVASLRAMLARKERQDKPKVVVVLGPNASGKSALGVKLALQLSSEGAKKKLGINGAEIISADSRQVYKELNIGSGKITKTEMRGVTHHLIDVASPKKVFTAAQYKERAKWAIHGISHRGKLPIIVGGTGFYIDALIYDISFPSVAPNMKLRKTLNGLSEEELLERLQELDPARASAIDPKNKRRVIRAIEIAEETGSAIPKAKKSSPYRVLKIGLELPEKKLREKIEERLKKRIRRGMIAEVKHLHENGVSWERLCSLGLEYRYVSEFLRNEMSRKEMEEKIKTESWRYAKRQMTWFKKDKEIIWITRPEKAFSIVQDFLGRSS